MSVAEAKEGQAGRLITLEGDSDIISCQLRLLPPSPKIMILPNLLDQLGSESETDAFNARAFILSFQKVIMQRTEVARSFLRYSTMDQPRLCFMVHGSTRARAICISKISQKISNGNVAEAEFIFDEIVKDGVAGLAERNEAIEAVPVYRQLEGENNETEISGEVRAYHISLRTVAV